MGSHKKPLFITFEGGEGAGKTTLIQRIEKSLLDKSQKVITTREPGGSHLGERIRQLLLEKTQNISIGSNAELLLFLASRVQHIEELIQPSLKEGKFVLCDRFNDSSVAYQGWARGLGMKKVQDLYNLVCGEVVPDITFFLDVDPSIGLDRARAVHKEYASSGEMDRIEAEKITFHRKVREGFQEIARQNPQRFIILDANQSAENVFADAWNIIEQKI